MVNQGCVLLHLNHNPESRLDDMPPKECSDWLLKKAECVVDWLTGANHTSFNEAVCCAFLLGEQID